MTTATEGWHQESRGKIGKVPFDRVTFEQALAAIASMVEDRRGGSVLTPNVDHVVLAETDARFQGAYDEARLSVADGMPVVWASRALGEAAPEKISGSDLVGPLMALAETRGWRVYLMGGADGVARLAADNLQKLHPRLVIAGVGSPRVTAADPLKRGGVANATDAQDRRAPDPDRLALIATIRATKPDLVLVGLGAPKQELWIHAAEKDLRPAVLLGVGASIDFLAGTAQRSPAWMSRVGLEWAYRLAQEPRRMWRRYLLRDPAFVRIFLQTWLDRSARGPRS